MRTSTNKIGAHAIPLLAAAIVVVGLAASCGTARHVGASGPADTSASDTAPATAVPTVPWRALLDPAPAGYVRRSARQRCCPATSTPTAPAAPAAPGQATAAFGPGDELRPPWLWLTLEAARPNTLDVLAPMQRSTRTTVNGLDALVDQRLDGVVQADVQLDAGHVLHAGAWGLTLDEVAAALVGVAPAGDGRLVVPHPPAATHEVEPLDQQAREHEPTFGADYLTGGRHHLSIAVTMDRRQLAASLPGVTSPSMGVDAGRLEQVEVQGQPALAHLVPTGDGGLEVMVVWRDGTGERVGQLDGEVASRAELDAALASVHDIDDAAWQDLLRRCPDPRAPRELVGSC